MTRFEKCWGIDTGKRFGSSQTFSRINTPTFLKPSHSTPTCLWRLNRQSVPKCRHIKFRRQGFTQKKAYNIQNRWKFEIKKSLKINNFVLMWVIDCYCSPLCDSAECGWSSSVCKIFLFLFFTAGCLTRYLLYILCSEILCLMNNLLTYSMVQSPSWEANWFAASQEIPRILWNPKVHYRIHKLPPPVLILG